MSNHVSPSSDWAELFEASRKFQDARPWKQLTDRILFGVRMPGAGPILHCAVMGAGGEVFGLAVYPGAEGLRAYERSLAIMREEGGGSRRELLSQLRALTVSFDPEEEVEDSDIDLLREQGLTIDGLQEWPVFRSYEPAYVEALPDEEERGWLVAALNGAREFVHRLRDGRLPDLDELGQDEIVVLKPGPDNTGWTQEIEALERGSEYLEVPTIDEFRLRRLARSAARGGLWEAAAYWLNMPVEEGDTKPYFPLLCAWADHNTGIILHTELTTPAEGLGMLQTSGIELMEKIGRIPATILVRSDKAVQLLEPVTRALHVELRQVETLDVMEDVVSELMKKLGKGHPSESEPEANAGEALMLQMGMAYGELLQLFEHWLLDQGYVWSTVQRHWKSVEAFLFGFLMEEGAMTPEEGLFEVDDFFGKWLPARRQWTSRQRIQAVVTGLKKFAAFLLDMGLLEEEDFQDFLVRVKARKDEWVRSALRR